MFKAHFQYFRAVTFLYLNIHEQAPLHILGSVGSVSPSPHHFILGLVSTFKHDDVSMLKTFMYGQSLVMTFLHLKVHNG